MRTRVKAALVGALLGAALIVCIVTIKPIRRRTARAVHHVSSRAVRFFSGKSHDHEGRHHEGYYYHHDHDQGHGHEHEGRHHEGHHHHDHDHGHDHHHHHGHDEGHHHEGYYYHHDHDQGHGHDHEGRHHKGHHHHDHDHGHDHDGRHYHWKAAMQKVRACHEQCGSDHSCHHQCSKPWAHIQAKCEEHDKIKACHQKCPHNDLECHQQCLKPTLLGEHHRQKREKKIRKHVDCHRRCGSDEACQKSCSKPWCQRLEARCAQFAEVRTCHMGCGGDHECHRRCPEKEWGHHETLPPAEVTTEDIKPEVKSTSTIIGELSTGLHKIVKDGSSSLHKIIEDVKEEALLV